MKGLLVGVGSCKLDASGEPNLLTNEKLTTEHEAHALEGSSESPLKRSSECMTDQDDVDASMDGNDSSMTWEDRQPLKSTKSAAKGGTRRSYADALRGKKKASGGDMK